MPSFHDFRFLSTDGKHKVFARECTPDGEVRAVLQIAHGVAEHVYRYAPFMEFLANNGFVVVANDHLGHGKTAENEQELCFFAEKDGWNDVVSDMDQLHKLTAAKYPDVPYFLFGHSMGSFYARWYAEKWPESIAAVIISGTAGPSFMNVIGQRLAGLIARVKGPRYVSPLMVKLNFGSYCKRIKNAKSANDWLTRDEAVVKAYDADGLCTFQFTASTYREMLATLNHVSSKVWAESINKELPVLLIAGDGDPVGDYGKGVRKVWAMLGDAGVKDLTCQIFEGGRHELHNETNRDEVFDYVLTWIEDHI